MFSNLLCLAINPFKDPLCCLHINVHISKIQFNPIMFPDSSHLFHFTPKTSLNSTTHEFAPIQIWPRNVNHKKCTIPSRHARSHCGYMLRQNSSASRSKSPCSTLRYIKCVQCSLCN